MIAGFEDFHFLRPLWLLGLLPVLAAIWLWWKYRSQSGWYGVIDANLLPFLLETTGFQGNKRWLHFLVLLTAWVAVVLALAGPAWQRIAQDVQIRKDALVVLLDLSLSMAAQDVSPSRLARSKFKLIDLFKRRNEGQTALIVYAGEAHTVVPFTDDTNTLAHLLPSLSPDIMPVLGSRSDLALKAANQLFTDNQINRGRILLITDGIHNTDRFRQAVSDDHDLVVLAVGTAKGAPVPDVKNPNQGFLKDNSGNLVIAQLNHNKMRNFIKSLGGLYQPLTLNQSDLDAALPERWWLQNQNTKKDKRIYDAFTDQGHWLIIAALPALIGLFRRGFLAIALVLLLPLYLGGTASPAFAQTQKEQVISSPPQRNLWDRLWWSGDQQGFRALQDNDQDEALAHFQSTDWRAIAHHINQDYKEAESLFSADKSADSHYNRGNALARQGRFLDSLNAYTEALKLEPKMADAHANSALMKKLLAEQQQANRSAQEEGQPESSPSEEGQNGQPGQEGKESQQPSKKPGEQSLADAEKADGKQSEEELSDKQATPKKPAEEADAPPEDEAMLAEAGAPSTSEEDEEAKQSLQHWLKRIPDDPGGLLRRKFKYESEQKGRARRQSEEPAW